MLTAAYFLANDEDQYFLRLPHLEELDAVEFYDYLLKAWGGVMGDATAGQGEYRRGPTPPPAQSRRHAHRGRGLEGILARYARWRRKALPYAQDAVERGKAVRQIRAGNNSWPWPIT